MRLRTVAALLILVILILLQAGCTGGQVTPPVNSGTIAAVVNGEYITIAELDYYRVRLRAKVMSEVAEQFSITYSESFWQTDLNGKTPQDILDETALNECITAKIKLTLCRENNIYTDISFAALKEKALTFNKENEGKTGVAGIKSIDLDSFYTYYIDTGVMQLKNILAQGELKPGEDELKNFINGMSKAQADAYTGDSFDSYVRELLITQKFDALIKRLLDEAVVTVQQ